ncbi:MAG: AI-2E family transporter [Patescibacteria group bacterium]|nr:AI-2E family transporter [Patescibacteria group bacterium]MDD5566777.1 AI-2E family transporter [Patescibacteria group bacterium]
MADKNTQNITISTTSILKVILIILAIWVLYLIKNVLGILFISLIITAGMTPWVDWLENKKIPRVLGTAILYVILLGIFSLVVILIIPVLSEQIGQIISVFPSYYDKIVKGFEALKASSGDTALVSSVQQSLGAINQSLTKAASGIFSSLVAVFGGFASFLSIMVIAFYLTLERNGWKKTVHALAPSQYQPYLTHLGNRITVKLGAWLRGQLLLCVIIFVMSYIGLTILGVKYALVLALIAGLTEFVPIIGPIVGAVPAIFLSFAQSPLKALLVLILYIVIQQLENNLIVPKVMQRSVGLNPIVVIIAMLIGAKLGGIIGMVLAIPIAAVIQVFSSDFFGQKRNRDDQLETTDSG